MVATTGRQTSSQDQEVSVGFSINSVGDAITARAGGTKALATQLENQINRISVCATNGDSVLLPQGKVGLSVVVINDGAANAQVFGKGTDTIDAIATATGVVLSATKRATYYCTSVSAAGVGAWQSNMGIPSA